MPGLDARQHLWDAKAFLPALTPSDPCIRGHSESAGTFRENPYRLFLVFGFLVLLVASLSQTLSAAETDVSHFYVQNYVIKGAAALSSNTVTSILRKYTGTNI